MGNKELIAALRERADVFESFNPDAVLLKRAANALEAQEWRDIESAPKDGEFIGYIPGYGATQMEFEDGVFWCVYRNSIVGDPTHWKPLDTPPETE